MIEPSRLADTSGQTWSMATGVTARRTRPTRQIRLRLALSFTRAEIKRLEARAAGEVRSVANYVAWVIQRDLAAKPRRQRPPLDANPRHKRTGYEVNLTLTIPERRELEKRAGAERRSLSNYVARLVVGARTTSRTT